MDEAKPEGTPPTQSLTSSAKPELTSPKTPEQLAMEVAQRTKLISEISTRYMPNNPGDVDLHLEKVRLLTSDTIDIPIKFLERAIKTWVKDKGFLPRASELFAYARGEREKVIKEKYSGITLQDRADQLNESLKSRDLDRSRQVQWVVNNGNLTLETVTPDRSRLGYFLDGLKRGKVTAEHVAKASKQFRMIAMERGYLRMTDDGEFVIRPLKIEDGLFND